MKPFLQLSFFRKKPRKLYRHAFYVYRDWIIILGLTVCLLVGSMVFHLYLFFATSSKSVVVPASPPLTGSLTINKAKLQNTLKLYTNLQANFELKKQETVSIVDPSF